MVLFAPPPTPPPPAAEIRVEATILQIPELPLSGQEASRRIGEVRRTLQKALVDVEANLRLLQSIPSPDATKGGFRIPKAQKEEAEWLASILRDPTYAALEEAFVRQWETSQQELVERGVAETSPDQAKASSPRVTSAEKLKADRQVRASSDITEGGATQIQIMSESAAVGGGTQVDESRKRLLARLEFANRRQWSEARVSMRARNDIAPDLAKAWSPLARHLNACAERITRTETIEGEEFGRLRTRSKVIFLTRFRAALWQCLNQWCLLATEPPPPALQPLLPEPAPPMAEKHT